MRRLLAATLAILALALLPASVFADSPERGRVFAVGDHVLAGETLTLLGEQLLAGDTLTVRLGTAAGTTDLGRAGVAADGTISFAAVVPAGTPKGYATVTASDGAGTEWTTTVLVGERAEGPKPGPVQGVSDDTSGVGIAMVVLGVVLFVLAGAWYARGRSKGSGAPR